MFPHRDWNQPRCNVIVQRAGVSEDTLSEAQTFSHHEFQVAMSHFGKPIASPKEGLSWDECSYAQALAAAVMAHGSWFQESFCSSFFVPDL